MEASYIIWDFEGTLATRKGRYTGALERAAAELDPAFAGSADRLRPHLSGAFPWHRAALAHPYANDPDGWWSAILTAAGNALKANGMAPDHIALALTASRRIYLDPSGWDLDPEALPTLRTLAERGWSHVILSNFAPELPELVTALGLSSHVDHIFCSARIGLEKPSQHLFEHVRRTLLPGRAVWMIGDNPVADIEGGRTAGLSTIHIAPSGTGIGRSVRRPGEIPSLITSAPATGRNIS